MGCSRPPRKPLSAWAPWPVWAAAEVAVSSRPAAMRSLVVWFMVFFLVLLNSVFVGRCQAVSATLFGRRSGSMPRSRMKLMMVSSPTPS